MIYCAAGYGCKYGAHCRYAHSDAQVGFFLRKQTESHAAKRFTVQCEHGANCDHPNCTFRHSDEEKAAIKARREAQPCYNWKTKLCKFFARGKCTNGNCPYAHGEGELRPAAHGEGELRPAAHGEGELRPAAHGKGELRPAAREGEALADRLGELRV